MRNRQVDNHKIPWCHRKYDREIACAGGGGQGFLGEVTEPWRQVHRYPKHLHPSRRKEATQTDVMQTARLAIDSTGWTPVGWTEAEYRNV